jgi:hypothetical protein
MTRDAAISFLLGLTGAVCGSIGMEHLRRWQFRRELRAHDLPPMRRGDTMTVTISRKGEPDD